MTGQTSNIEFTCFPWLDNYDWNLVYCFDVQRSFQCLLGQYSLHILHTPKSRKKKSVANEGRTFKRCWKGKIKSFQTNRPCACFVPKTKSMVRLNWRVVKNNQNFKWETKTDKNQWKKLREIHGMLKSGRRKRKISFFCTARLRFFRDTENKFTRTQRKGRALVAWSSPVRCDVGGRGGPCLPQKTTMTMA